MIDLWSFGWQRGEGGELLINLFCVHGFEIHPCRLVFKNSWTAFGKHKNIIYLIFIKTYQKKLSDHKNLVKESARKHLKFV